MDLISVVIPVYKVEKYLKECVDSVINQTYKNLDIILVDDGSPDECGNTCDEYASKDKRIKVIHKENGGLSDARNFGIEAAKGEYIAFVDSDDYIELDFVEKLYNLCKTYKCEIAECSFGRFENKSVHEKEENIEINVTDGKNHIDESDSKNHVKSVVVWNKLYKIELFENIKFPKGKIHEDEFTTYKIYYNAKSVVTTNEVLYNYRDNPGSITNNRTEKSFINRNEALAERIKFYKENKEIGLYELTIITYVDSLIETCEYFKNDSEKLDIFKSEYNKYYEELKKIKGNQKKKIKHILYKNCPHICMFLINFRKSRRNKSEVY